MFTLRFRPLISIAMIASLFVAQFASIPHVHAGLLDNGSEHSSRSHIHVGYNGTSKHTHAHGHSHSDSPGCATKNKSKTQRQFEASAVDHDRDAVYLVQSQVPLSVRLAFQVEHKQPIGVQPICLSNLEHQNQPDVDYGCWHMPDQYRPCPIYLLTLSIRC